MTKKSAVFLSDHGLDQRGGNGGKGDPIPPAESLILRLGEKDALTVEHLQGRPGVGRLSNGFGPMIKEEESSQAEQGRQKKNPPHENLTFNHSERFESNYFFGNPGAMNHIYHIGNVLISPRRFFGDGRPRGAPYKDALFGQLGF